MARFLCLLSTSVAALFGASSCSVPEYADLAGITVVAAELDASLVAGGMMGGGGAGNGSLEILVDDGSRQQLDVRLTTGMTIMGLEAFGIAIDDRPLTLPEGGILLDELLDVYRCEGAAVHFLIGYNIQGCAVNGASFSFDGVDAGFGIRMGGVSWMALDWDDGGSVPGPEAPLDDAADAAAPDETTP